MPRSLPALMILLAALGALWLFFWSDSVDPATPDLGGFELETSAEADLAPEPLESELPEDADVPDDETPEPEPEPLPEDEPEKPDPTVGGLELRVTDRDGQVLDREGVTARITYVRRPDRPAIPGVAEGDTAVFRFRELPLGAARVFVEGDLLMTGMLQATIQGGATSRRSLIVKRAAALQYDIQYADGTRPKEVHLSLLDAQAQPVRARYRPDPAGETPARPRQGRLVRVPPQGVVFGLRPGTYTLKAVITGGGAGAETVSVSVGATTWVVVALEP